MPGKNVVLYIVYIHYIVTTQNVVILQNAFASETPKDLFF